MQLSHRSVWYLPLIIVALMAGVGVTAVILRSQIGQFLPGWGGIPYSSDYDKVSAIPMPAGYQRVASEPDSFANYLRQLPLKQENNLVHLYTGQVSPYQWLHFAVIDKDVGEKDLQQCADFLIRLRAEHLFERGRTGEIGFHLTNGDLVSFQKYAQGYRPVVRGNEVDWQRSALADASHQKLREYLEFIFTYAGTASLREEMEPVGAENDVQIGDVLVKTGVPLGHAVMVVDMAVDPATGRTIGLFAEGSTPAQEFHIMKNYADPRLSPWHDLERESFQLAGWDFVKGDWRRF